MFLDREIGPLRRRSASRTLALALLVILAPACASIGTGDPLIVRTQDVLTHSLTAYEAAMTAHYALSTSESPEVYESLEALRVKFPPLWRGLNGALKTYTSAKTKDPVALRAGVLAFLDSAEALGPPSWKSSLRMIRDAFEGDPHAVAAHH